MNGRMMTLNFRRTLAPLAVVLAAALSACGGQAQPTVTPTFTPLPTLIPERVDPPTPNPTATAVLIATLPPEWTPTPSITPLASATPPPLATFDTVNAMLLTSPTLPACSAFLIDTATTQSSFTRSEGARVAWNAVEGVLAYRINLYDDARTLQFTAIIGETQFTFGPTLFQPMRRYFWEVRPFDSAGTQLCAAMGGLLIPVS